MSDNQRTPKFCHLCGRRLEGQGWVYGQDEVTGTRRITVCSRCEQEALRCDVCDVPVGPQHWQLADGRHICVTCHQTAIYDPARARALFDRTVGIIVSQLGLTLHVGTDFALVDRNRLMELLEANAEFEAYSGTRTLGLFVRQGRRRTIFVESGLPQITVVQTVAHEWAHAWQGENCPLLKDRLVREGFAEWVAYKVLEAMGAVKKMALMKKRKDVYGQGLEHMSSLEREGGIAGVLAYCRRVE
jgi:hypothetical protein